jgi:hypothetical protein
VPTLADRGCRVVSATNPHGRYFRFSRPLGIANIEQNKVKLFSIYMQFVGFQEMGQIYIRNVMKLALFAIYVSNFETVSKPYNASGRMINERERTW